MRSSILTATTGLLCTVYLIFMSAFLAPASAQDTGDYLIGRGMADVTGPAYGSPMWGFGQEKQTTQGIHTRLKSRAFILIDPTTQNRLVFASVDIGSIEHNVFLEVVDRLQAKYGNTYTLDNVILSATHTHSGPAGYWHTRLELGLSGAFYKKHFDRIVSGIVASIEQAHTDIAPGSILINKGNVVGAGANRSMAAYNANPEDERAQYALPMDLEMTLLKFNRAQGPVGMLNWFAVHPTSMTFDNHLISGDHKGYASLTWEKLQNVRYVEDNNFVAAFAQSTPGDITPNLNLNNTGPGIDMVDSTKIIGQRQLDVAQDLFAHAAEKVTGPLDVRRAYIDMSNYQISDAFTGAGTQTTCPSAYGYSFGGGSTEDGGGFFLLSEGMKEQSWWLDFLTGALTGAPKWTQEVKDCQAPKPILFETGTGTPPLQSQIRSVSVARIGSIALIAMPAEITTMAARRLRATAQAALGPWAKHIIISGYANGYAGYVTTPQEYETQQYEGGHTLHGKWSLPAYRQIITDLARALETNTPVATGPAYDDWRGKSVSSSLVTNTVDVLPEGVSLGDSLPLTQTRFSNGEIASVDFWSGNPSAGYSEKNDFIQIEHLTPQGWRLLYGDMDWSTTIRWRTENDAMIARVSWTIPQETPAGTYRIKHQGVFRAQPNQLKDFEATSPEFAVIQ